LPVKVIGRIIIIIIITLKPKPANVQAFLKSVEEAHASRKVPVVLR
jgi:quinol monooxygenase YgiN